MLTRPRNTSLKPGKCATKTQFATKSESSSQPHPFTSANTHRLILTYLIPCHLLTTHTLPTLTLLAPYPRLQSLFLPLSRCIKSGDLSGFDAALVAGEDEFTKRRIYLTLERGRDIALRNLLRKVFLAGGFEENAKDPSAPPVRRTRIPVAEFGAAISLGGKEQMEGDEVECLLSTMIYKVFLLFLALFPVYDSSTSGMGDPCRLLPLLPGRLSVFPSRNTAASPGNAPYLSSPYCTSLTPSSTRPPQHDSIIPQHITNTHRT